MFPSYDPQIVAYVVMKKPKYGGNSILKEAFKEFVSNIAKYKNIFKVEESDVLETIILPNYLNKSVSDTKIELQKKNIMTTSTTAAPMSMPVSE